MIQSDFVIWAIILFFMFICPLDETNAVQEEVISQH